MQIYILSLSSTDITIEQLWVCSPKVVEGDSNMDNSTMLFSICSAGIIHLHHFHESQRREPALNNRIWSIFLDRISNHSLSIASEDGSCCPVERERNRIIFNRCHPNRDKDGMVVMPLCGSSSTFSKNILSESCWTLASKLGGTNLSA